MTFLVITYVVFSMLFCYGAARNITTALFGWIVWPYVLGVILNEIIKQQNDIKQILIHK